MQVKEISPNKYRPATDKQKADAKEAIKTAQKKGEKQINGFFEFIDAGAGFFDFAYRFYPGEPIRTIRLIHGECCDMPLDLVKHLNGCKKKIRVFPENNNADKSKPTFAYTSRVKFTPTDVY